ncbi:ribosome recycling factor family protein [Agarivorans sp. TSD2052]|uniref:ribosome recycling factor family protein n=1 Tax=Agarivorans sp. TSD2052 TaxID=2937286 RepID=UPI00200DEE4A|nr:ribosome recycling factor family protein [Agarivorans sp. TSD2052]UPW17288.1 ribosome recycling factor family protein [Agarivorans sp. TSD2052]
MSDKHLTIPLPSLIRRIGGDNTKIAKQMALECGCLIKRVRRSRNWQLIGEEPAIISLNNKLKALDIEAMAYLCLKLEEHLKAYQEQQEPKQERLKRLIDQSPNITLAELIHITDCTLAEARQARFDSDSL